MDSLEFATRSYIRNVIACGLLTIALAACGGGGSGSSGTGSAATSAAGLVSSNSGLVDRSSASGTSTPDAAVPPVTNPPATNPLASTTGAATLDWTPPTQNSDGSALANLAGYTVYYGTTQGNLNQSVQIANPGLASYTVTNLASGTWYFAVTAYSSTGTESSRTVVVSTTI